MVSRNQGAPIRRERTRACPVSRSTKHTSSQRGLLTRAQATQGYGAGSARLQVSSRRRSTRTGRLPSSGISCEPGPSRKRVPRQTTEREQLA
jgi:hypothetical protein